MTFGFGYTWHMVMVFLIPMSAVFYIGYVYREMGHKTPMQNKLK